MGHFHVKNPLGGQNNFHMVLEFPGKIPKTPPLCQCVLSNSKGLASFGCVIPSVYPRHFLLPGKTQIGALVQFEPARLYTS